VKPSTSASRSQPSGNTKKDKNRQTPISTQKNKVEAHKESFGHLFIIFLILLEEPVEEPEEEPEPNNGHGNQFAQHPNPQPGNMNGWLEEDDDMNENVNNEDIEDEDVEIEVDDDAELIFPYEVEGDQTPPPRDESSDSEPPNAESSDFVSYDSESEDEEVDVAPEATVGTSSQKPYAIRDFPRGLYEVGESSSARDSSYVGGLAPWALRHDLETSRARARPTEAELSTNQTEIALLKSLS
ncbi:hypothetical protein Tco_0374323, partial [Tanacetum coccineum]